MQACFVGSRTLKSFWTVTSRSHTGDIIEPLTHCNYNSNAQSLRPSHLSPQKIPVSFRLFFFLISIQFQLSSLMENHRRGNNHLIPTHLVRNDYYAKHGGKWQTHPVLNHPNIVFFLHVRPGKHDGTVSVIFIKQRKAGISIVSPFQTYILFYPSSQWPVNKW